MVSVLMILAIALIIAVTMALGWRKKYYAKIDKTEERKVELMNSPVLEEVARIRNLNLEGETESAFEGWRERWSDVMNVQFPHLEEDFFRCESMVEKFRFGKANQILDEINGKLDGIEETISLILSESSDLLALAKKNEDDLIKIQNRLNEKTQYIFAIAHLFGESTPILNERIGTLAAEADQINRTLQTGDYFAAGQELEELEIKCQVLEETIKSIPDLMNECKKVLPETIGMLKQAYDKMETEGYPLENLNILQQVEELENTVALNLQSLELAIVEGIKESVNDINNKINVICRKLEAESTSRVFVKEKMPTLIRMLGENKKSFDQLQAEVENSRGKYRIPDKVEDSIVNIKIEFLDCTEQLESIGMLFTKKEAAFSILEAELHEIETKIVRMNIDITTNLEDVATLMVDEQLAINRVAELRETFNDLEALVRLSNAPGISIRHKTISSDTLASIEEVNSRLLDEPLNIVAIKDALHSAERKTATLEKESNELVENSLLAEKVIQYGNRYRIEDEYLSEQLDRATEKFMIFEYTKSLEIASIAIEQVEPGFARKFDTFSNAPTKQVENNEIENFDDFEDDEEYED